MKAKTESKETYSLTEKQFTHFAKALVSVPKKEVDKQLTKESRAKAKAHSRPKTS